MFSAALAALLPACSSTDSGPGPSAGAPGTAGAPGAAGASPMAGAPGAAGMPGSLTGDATRGAALWVKGSLGCNTCHGEHAEGGAAPNITKSASGGIGAFTLAQFKAAIRDHLNKQGGKLCDFMPTFTPAEASDQDIADLYAFQQAQPTVDAPVKDPSFCPPAPNMCCTGEHK